MREGLDRHGYTSGQRLVELLEGKDLFPMVLNSSEGPVFGAQGDGVDPCNDTAAWDWVYSFQPTYMAIICFLGAVGNAFVICVLWQQRKHRTVADIYLCNLAAADLVLVSCLPFWAVTVANEFHWPFGEPLCKLINGAISTNYFCSVMSLVLVSVDRYLALARPLSFGRLRDVRQARRLCLAVWVLSVALSLPVLAFRATKWFPELGVMACYLAFPHDGWRVQRNITINVVGFLVPVPVLAFCSYHVITALRDSRLMAAQYGLRAERKATRLVLIVFTIFIICWLPHQVVRFLDTLDYFQVIPSCTWGYVLDIGTQLSTYLAFGNSALNPLLYVVVGKHFRKKAKGMLTHLLSSKRRDKSSFTVQHTSTVRCNESTKVSLELLKIPFSEKL